MALQAQTAKSLARILIEESGDAETASRILERWNEVKGINGNFRMTNADILAFVKKLGTKEKHEEPAPRRRWEELSTEEKFKVLDAFENKPSTRLITIMDRVVDEQP